MPTFNTYSKAKKKKSIAHNFRDTMLFPITDKIKLLVTFAAIIVLCTLKAENNDDHKKKIYSRKT